ncbi:YrhB domain-containing protein [Streptomyces flaveolus]|uniref:YrhB domain-containing protein n=1 Tax=Streptomyces flaveolus TaxID=67297 RepID=UPI00332618E2
MDKDEALKLAVAFLASSQRDDEPPLAVDLELTRESNGLLIAPYNCVQYLATRDPRDQLLDCWPILVDLDSGNVRFGLLEERHLWRLPSPGQNR